MDSIIYSLGSNQYGQLGIDHYEDTDIPTRVLGIPSNDTEIKCIKGGGNHTLILFNNGSVYGAGDNRFGQVGTCSEKVIVGFHEIVKENIKLISAGFDHSVFITKDNRIYVCGSNTKGQLGNANAASCQDNLIMEINLPITHDKEKTIVHLASGMYHNVIVLSDNSVYGWGYARNGQLGDDDDDISGPIVTRPKRIINITNKPIKSISCGRTFTVILFQDDNVQVLGGGSNRAKLLEIPPTLSDCTNPVVSIGATWNSIHILRRDGHHEAWGSNNNGQLLTLDSASLIFSQIAVGSAHVVGLTINNNKVIAWGWAKHGNCGEIRKQDINEMQSYIHPNVIDVGNKIVTHVAAGSATTFIVVNQFLVDDDDDDSK